MWGVLQMMTMFDKVNVMGGNKNIHSAKMIHSRRMARKFSVRMAKGAVYVAVGILVLKWILQVTHDVNDVSLIQLYNESLLMS